MVSGLSKAEALRKTTNPYSRQHLSRVINLLSMVGDTTSRGEGNKYIGKFLIIVLKIRFRC